MQELVRAQMSSFNTRDDHRWGKKKTKINISALRDRPFSSRSTNCTVFDIN